MASEITCSLKQIKQCRQMTPLCCVGTVGVGWGGTVGVGWGGTVGVGWGGTVGVGNSLGENIISNDSPKYLQPKRVISRSCNYPQGYLPSDPTSGQSIVLFSTVLFSIVFFPPSILAYLKPFIPCHGSQ